MKQSSIEWLIAGILDKQSIHTAIDNYIKDNL